jgi:hypothetical protein
MRSAWRRLLDAAERVRDFTLANVLPDPRHQATVAQLDHLIARAHRLLADQRDGLLATRAAREERLALRRTISGRFFHVLVTVARRAARDLPEVFGTFKLPRANASNRTYAVQASAMLATAKEHADTLAAQGLGDAVIPELVRAVAELDRLSRVSVETGRTHIEATSALGEVTRELTALIKCSTGITGSTPRMTRRSCGPGGWSGRWRPLRLGKRRPRWPGMLAIPSARSRRWRGTRTESLEETQPRIGHRNAQ